MHFKYLVFLVSTIMCANSELHDVEEMYLNFFVQIESVKKSIDILKIQVDILSERNPKNTYALIDKKFSQVFENFDVVKKSLDNLNTRLDASSDMTKNKLPEVEVNMEKLEQEQKILVQEISEMKEKYTNLSDELTTIKKSEEILKQKNADMDSKYLDLIKKYEHTKKSNDELKLQIDVLTGQISSILSKEKAIENYEKKPLFDVRVDKLPEFKEYCYQDPEPIDCKMATKCTKKSGYYKIYLPGNKSKQIMVFCDTQTNGGDWMHILRRQDGSEKFTRPWADYVKGFGKVEGEYWIGLENLHALTSYNGRQQLYVYVENFEGQSSFAFYDNFAVGSASEMYELKSLGKYYGMGEDDMSYNVGSKFSTIDRDNDNWPTGSCANERQAGWWYNYCSYVQPTGQYLHGESSRNAVLWRSFDGLKYSHKIMYLMIRN